MVSCGDDKMWQGWISLKNFKNISLRDAFSQIISPGEGFFLNDFIRPRGKTLSQSWIFKNSSQCQNVRNAMSGKCQNKGEHLKVKYSIQKAGNGVK